MIEVGKLKIFKNKRVYHNITLLEILGILAKAKKPLSVYTIAKLLGKNKAYSGIQKNVDFLEQRGFLTSRKHRKGRRRRLCKITVKGALASLFCSSFPVDHSKLLDLWRGKDWGDYKDPFQKIEDVSELREFVETLYLHGGSLEDVDKGLLRRGLRNPQESIDLITKAFVTVKKITKETGEYEAKMTFVPGSVAVGKMERQHNVFFVINPKEETGQIFFDLFSQNSAYERQVGEYLQAIIETVARHVVDKEENAVDSIYFPNSRRFIIVATIPEKVASLLVDPRQVLKPMKDSYFSLIESFLENDEFVNGNHAQFIFQALRYDPETQNLSPLPKNEIRDRAHKILNQMSLEKQRHDYHKS